jgi:hypothetical protein
MITNVLNAPNSFLKCFSSHTLAVSVNNYISFGQYRKTDFSFPHDNTFADDLNFKISTQEANDLSLLQDTFGGSLCIYDNTKKAIIKIHKHPIAPVQDFLCSYSIGKDMAISTASAGSKPFPLNALAKDGDEFEIYGVNEIRKFFCTPLDASMNPVPYLITIHLFK